MAFLMTLRIALRGAGGNKLRAVLTMLGIIIGVGAVIAMVAIGERRQGDRFARRSPALGTNVLIIVPGSDSQGGVAPASATSIRFSTAMPWRSARAAVGGVLSPVLRRRSKWSREI